MQKCEWHSFNKHTKLKQKAWVQFSVFIESSISLSDESRFFRFLSVTDPLKSLCMTTERRIQLMSGGGSGDRGRGRGQDDTIHTVESMSGSRGRHGKYGIFARTPPDQESRVHWDLKPWSPWLPPITPTYKGSVYVFGPALLVPPLLAAAGRTRLSRRAEGTDGGSRGRGGARGDGDGGVGSPSTSLVFFSIQHVCTRREKKKTKRTNKQKKETTT